MVTLAVPAFWRPRQFSAAVQRERKAILGEGSGTQDSEFPVQTHAPKTVQQSKDDLKFLYTKHLLGNGCASL